jgi:hypothetical protein
VGETVTTETTATPPVFDFYLDADDQYQPKQLPTGTVKMGGKEYTVHCPKDSLPMLLGRIDAQARAAKEPAEQEEIIRSLVAACFDPDDATDIINRVVSPYERLFSVAFLVDVVQKVYQQYGPLLDAEYAELGIENPVKQPTDRPASSKTGRPAGRAAGKKTATAKKAAAAKTAARRAASV